MKAGKGRERSWELGFDPRAPTIYLIKQKNVLGCRCDDRSDPHPAAIERRDHPHGRAHEIGKGAGKYKLPSARATL